MTIHIISTSSENLVWAQSGIQEYRKRIKRFRSLVEHTLPQKKSSQKTREVQKQLDHTRILEHTPKQSHIMVLDATGQQYDSHAFACHIEKQQQNLANLTFIIGPAYGLDPALIQRFPCLSLSKMTTQHELAKLFLFEQIYRALTILNNHPYSL